MTFERLLQVDSSGQVFLTLRQRVLLNAVAKLQANHLREMNRIMEHASNLNRQLCTVHDKFRQHSDSYLVQWFCLQVPLNQVLDGVSICRRYLRISIRGKKIINLFPFYFIWQHLFCIMFSLVLACFFFLLLFTSFSHPSLAFPSFL